MTSETTERNSYIGTFITDKPSHALKTVNHRLQTAIKVNDELAEYFRERAQIEDVYAKSMSRLSKKQYILDKDTLGQFSPTWDTIHNELSSLAAIHSEYAHQITENVEHPLRACIVTHPAYADIHKMDEHIQRIAREHDEINMKIQKHKKHTKSEGKLIEVYRQKELKTNEWQNLGVEYIEKHQTVDEYRWNFIKSSILSFEALQQTHLQKISELSERSFSHTETFDVQSEIESFCSSHITHSNTNYSDASHEHPQPETSLSDSSLKQPSQSIKKDKKRFFSSLVSIRRKPKSDSGYINTDKNLHPEPRQRSISNAGSYIESSSVHSNNTFNTDTNEGSMTASNSANKISQLASDNGNTSSSPTTSVGPTTLQKPPSLIGSVQSGSSSHPPLIMIDAEGYSIPPANRSAWTLDSANSDALVDTEEITSDSASGSILSNSRIRVDIQNEAVNDEDAGNAAVALTRVATLLKEKNPNATRKYRGRRELRAMNLHSVVEKPPSAVSNLDVSDSSPFSNPFEISQKEHDAEAANDRYREDLPEIDVRIEELIHVYSIKGEAEKSAVVGEISIKYTGPTETSTPICFQLTHSEDLDEIECTDRVTLCDNEGPDLYQINIDKFGSSANNSGYMTCIKYRKNIDAQSIPLKIKALWKCEETKSRLLIKYHQNESSQHILDNIAFATAVTGNVQNALSIPAGELILSHNRMKWNIESLNGSEEQIIRAQFSTLEQGTPQPILARFEIKEALLTSTDVEHGDRGIVIWPKICSVSKSVKAGKYIAMYG
ncbi:Muniscin C-terminal mu homology domain-containing protein [Pilobolus umbonatus]|nr:Muniscin C-terminal mu homology domain-containing protein [Pilobolus umbonatus]